MLLAGTFAVVCLMTGKVVGDFATDPSDVGVSSVDSLTDTPTYTPNQVAAVVALMNGIVEVRR